jgi:UDP-glucose 4-epimerase
MASIDITHGRILVVGGAGFVGSNLCHFLLNERAPEELWIVDNLLSSDASNIPNDPRVRFLFGSITDDAILHRLPHDFDVVFHLACYHGNQSSIADPLADHDNNSLTSLKLFEHLKNDGARGLKKVVYSAAGCAVAEKTFDDALPTTEDAPVSLFHDSPYSISKLIGEMYGNYYFQRYGMPFVKARFQNVYGPHEILGAGRWRGTPHTVWRNVTPTFIWKSIHGEALPLENGGQAGRDFIFVEDIVRGLVACAERGRPGEAYNLASGIETSIADLARMINEITGNRTPVHLLPARDWDRSGRRYGSTEKSRIELGFEATTSMEEGLRRTIEWTIGNRAQVERAIAAHDVFMRALP